MNFMETSALPSHPAHLVSYKPLANELEIARQTRTMYAQTAIMCSYLLTPSCGVIHPGRVEPASPRYGDVSSAEVPSLDVAAFSCFAAQAKLVRFVSTRESALHALPFFLIQVTQRRRKGI